MAKRVPYLTTSQVARMIGKTNGAVTAAVKRGELSPINSPQPGKQKFFAKFNQKDVDEWINSRRTQLQSIKKIETPVVAVQEKIPMPGKLSAMDEKLDSILDKLNQLISLWS